VTTLAARKGKKDKSMFDTSKIPDIWDNLYYDLITHRPDLEPFGR
jgi:hypothetical protein